MFSASNGNISHSVKMNKIPMNWSGTAEIPNLSLTVIYVVDRNKVQKCIVYHAANMNEPMNQCLF